MTGSIALLTLAAIVFVGSHLAMANEPLRSAIVRRTGEMAFLGLFSAVAFVTLAWLLLAYGEAPYIELWHADPGLRHLAVALMPFAFILVVCGYLTPNPSAAMQARMLKGEHPARGIMKVTRHPVMWGIVLWAVLHIAVNGDVGSVVFVGAFLVLAGAGMILLDRKKRATLGSDWARFAAVTSILPFGALAGGRARVTFGEIG